MRLISTGLAGLALLAATSAAHADWDGQIGAGLVVSRGNTDNTTVNAKVDISKTYTKWKHSFFLAGLYAEDDVATTAQRYDTRFQSDYSITPRAYWFGGLRYEDDEFSSFDYQASATTGFGYRFVDTERVKFSAQIGAGYRRMRDLLTQEEIDDLVWRGDSTFEWKLTGNSTIRNKFIVEAGSDNTFVGNDLALEVTIYERFALSVGYGLRYNSDPGTDLGSTDTLTTLNLVYSVG